MVLRFLLVASVVLFLGSSAGAQPVGDANQGQILADIMCSECHPVSDSEYRQGSSRAASFQAIANTPGMTPLALSVWFRTPHRDMPNIILSKDEQEDLIAYITSLKKQN
jgi:mono/diheme cytochrome c family protein